MSRLHDSFPVQILQAEARRVANPPLSVPLVWLLPYDRAFQERHGVSLAVLAARGGCDPREIWAALHEGTAADVSLMHALLWLEGRPWDPRQLEEDCAVCGGTFKAEAVGDHPDEAMVSARAMWRNAHHPRCGLGLREERFDVARWPFTRVRVTFEVGLPTR